jgi:ssDNA-binding Zn-finger/Zn-ribbon topoisomerase 1
MRCPDCGASMVVRTAKHGPSAGRQSYGCSGYPTCKATRPIEPESMVQKLKCGGCNILRAAPESQFWAYGTPLA